MAKKENLNYVLSAKVLVERWWEGSANIDPNPMTIYHLHRVAHSEPKELIEDFEMLADVLNKAIKQLKKGEK